MEGRLSSGYLFRVRRPILSKKWQPRQGLVVFYSATTQKSALADVSLPAPSKKAQNTRLRLGWSGEGGGEKPTQGDPVGTAVLSVALGGDCRSAAPDRGPLVLSFLVGYSDIVSLADPHALALLIEDRHWLLFEMLEQQGRGPPSDEAIGR
jgi:hypothetical protein